MKTRATTAVGIARIMAIVLCLTMMAAFVMPATAQADKPEKIVRVGWYESTFNSTDQLGRRSGLAYEYQQKIAAYTGWKYEYVEGSWPELLEKLKAGEIDLLSDVSYTDERSDYLRYSSLPMGTEEYYVYCALGNNEITMEDITTLNGKSVGANKGSVQVDIFKEWCQMHDIQPRIVEMTETQGDAMQLLLDGKIDAYLSLDSFGSSDKVEPICNVGSSDYYFAISNDRPDLETQLDAAMAKIIDENRYYNQELYEKYVRASWANLYLTAGESAWLSKHGTIRVGYQDNYLAFCASDETTGELTGALKDFLDTASDCMENIHIDFQAIAYPTAEAAIEALKNGEIDCMFPSNLTNYDGEVQGVAITPSAIRSDMYAVVREADQQSFILKDPITVAVNEGNPNYDMFLLDHFPNWQIKYYKNSQECLKGIAAGEADCLLISIYRYNNISKLCNELDLTTVFMGINMDYCFAVKKGQTELYSILSKVIGMVPTSTVNASLTYYSTEDVKTSPADIAKRYLPFVVAIVSILALVIVLLVLRNIRAEKKALEEQRLVEDLNKRVFVDALTSIRNKGAFDNYIEELQAKLESTELTEFAIGVFDCDNLKTINDENGHDKGDEYLKAASHLICHVFQHSPVFRIGGDEFAAVLLNDDYRNRLDLVDEFDRAQDEVNASVENAWDEVHVAVGVAVYDSSSDRSVNDVVRRADMHMYENKRLGKLAAR